MNRPASAKDIDELRAQFDAMYIGAVPQLLTEDGAFLAFLATLTGTEALAGFFAPDQGAGQRFTRFVETFFPPNLNERANELLTVASPVSVLICAMCPLLA